MLIRICVNIKRNVNTFSLGEYGFTVQVIITKFTQLKIY